MQFPDKFDVIVVGGGHAGTEAALASMGEDRVREAIVRAIRAASERGRQLGEELGRD